MRNPRPSSSEPKSRSRLHFSSPASTVEEDVGGVPVVVVRDVRAAQARAFDRRIGGRALSFEAVPGERPLLAERGGPRRWYLRSGTAVPGSGAEADLCPLPATAFEAEAWALQHPEGTTWRRH